MGSPEEDESGVWAGLAGGVRRFSHDEMVACAECLRANPPTRMNCLYCGARLPASDRGAEHLRPTLRRLEEWEGGYNIVVEAGIGREVARDALAESATFLKLEPAQLAAILAAGRRLPLARAASAEEAELVAGRLAALGLAAFIVGDDELKTDEPPRRASALALTDEALSARVGAGGERVAWLWSDLSLFVSGRLVSRRVEVEERQARLGSRSELVEAREMAADETVLDIYPREESGGLRILAGRFDYSCLGARKGLLAGENFAALVSLLRARAPQAAFDDDYPRVRHLLAAAWPPTEKTESGGLRRDRPGRFNTEAVTIVSNEAQFTRYSRLRRHLAERGRIEAT